MTGAIRKHLLLLGHRGARARKSIPENTFASFDQALEDGCDGFEFDVRMTRDGQAVICHDAQNDGVEIASAASQDCAGLPRLEDVLACYHVRAFLDIELKVSGVEKATISALRRYPPARDFVVSSFLPEVLQTVHAEDPSISLGVICQTDDELVRWKELAIQYVIPHHKLMRANLIKDMKNAGKKILVWTVNSRAEMQRLREWGVDGIISDDTRLLARTLS